MRDLAGRMAKRARWWRGSRPSILRFLSCVEATSIGRSQVSEGQGRFDLDEHFQHLYESVPREFGFRAETRDEFEAWQRAFRPRLAQALGLTNMQKDLSDHTPWAEKTGSEDMAEYVRERWYLWTEPDVPLPLWVLIPKGEPAGRPLVLTPHGHNHPDLYVGITRDADEEKRLKEGQRAIAVQSVMEGYLTIAPTTRGFGETAREKELAEGKNSSCRIELMHDLLVGRTPIGERVWDMSRIIDWALAEFDVDARRIAITGNSGGGTVSLFAAAMEERITVSVPGSYFCTFVGSIGSIGHCDCNYVPGILRLGEMYDVAGLTAPRAFCAICGKEDAIFPIGCAREAFTRLKEIYAIAGVPDRCALYEGEGGHRYYADGSWPFIKKHFEAAG